MAKRNQKQKQVGISDVICDLLYILLFVLTTVYTLYRPNGYVDLGEEKFRFFRWVCIAVFVMAAGIAVILVTKREMRDALFNGVRTAWKENRLLRMWDLFFAGMAVSHLLSFLFSCDKQTALWGVEDWRTGFLPFLAMLLLYAVFGCFFQIRKGFRVILLLAPAFVAFLGILNRFDIYVDLLIFQTDSYYLSTIGNINWFAGFLSVFLAASLAVSMTITDRWSTVFSFAGSAVFLCASLLQGSDSLVAAFAAMAVVLFFAGTKNRNVWNRLWYLALLAGLCMELCGLLVAYSGRYNFYADQSFAVRLCLRHAGVCLILVAAVLLVISRRRKNSPLPEKLLLRLARTTGVAMGVLIALSAVVLWYSVSHPDAVRAVFHSDALVLSDDWGSGRGLIIRLCTRLLRTIPPGGKLFGIGQDCIYAYTRSKPELMQLFYEAFNGQILTNAHNIPLTTLLNRGLTGLVTDIGFYVLAVATCVGFVRDKEDKPLLLVALCALLSYMLNGLFSFEQLLSTPFLFVLLGMARSAFFPPEISIKK